MITQLIVWLALAVLGGSHINGCLNDTWHGHNVIIRVSQHAGVVTMPRTRHNTCPIVKGTSWTK